MPPDPPRLGRVRRYNFSYPRAYTFKILSLVTPLNTVLKHENHPQQPPFRGITFNVLFVGLDASSSLELLQHLNVVAESGRLIILTIHQPRLEIFHLFHKILLLCDGQVSNCSPHVSNCSPHVGNFSPCVRESNLSNWILDSAPWIPDSKCCNPDSLQMELGLRTPILSGIPDSLSCIQDSKVQDSGFHK